MAPSSVLRTRPYDGGSAADGQAHPEDAEAVLAGVGEAAVVALLDDPTRDVQPEAGALADLLGREERLERPGRDVVGHAGPGVGELDDDVVAVGARRDPQRARA